MSAPMCTPETEAGAARAQWAAHYATRDGFRYMPAEELVRYCGRRGSLGRVVEVGCGNGANLWYLAEHATSTLGVDFCLDALDAARSLCQHRSCTPRLVAGALGRLPLQSGSADTLVDCMVSQHVPWRDHRQVFTDYRRVLCEGGSLFLYHLAYGTSGTGGARSPLAFDFPEGIKLFPLAGFVSLPFAAALRGMLHATGFGRIVERELTRVYPNGARATYAVIEGTAE